MGDFKLLPPEPPKPPARGLTVGELAKALGRTAETLRQYHVRDGMPALPIPADAAEGLPRRFDLDACRAWIEQHKPNPVHGGRRSGAGRKASEEKSGSGAADDGLGAGFGGFQTMLSAEDRDVRQAIKNIKSPDDILALLREEKISPTIAKMLKDSIDAMTGWMDMELKRGNLLKADEVRAAWDQVLARAADQLESGPARWERDLVAAGLVKPDQGHAARALLEQGVAAVMSTLARGKEEGVNAEDAESAEVSK